MNNVYSITLRPAGLCLRSSAWPKPSKFLFRALQPHSLCSRLAISSTGRWNPHLLTSDLTSQRNHGSTRSFSNFAPTNFRNAATRYALGPLKQTPEPERGLAFGEEPLTEQELRDIFGTEVPAVQKANRLLRVLHGRRVDGTLDLPLPDDLEALMERYPNAVEDGLYWLRDNYYIDEDEAIIARIEREESGYDERSPSQLRQRAQDLKLYGPQSGKFDEQKKERTESKQPEYYGPQSGKYQAKLSEKGDVFGESQIEKIRAQNEADFEKEEKELEEQIEQIQAKRIAQAEEEKSQALAARPEQGVETAQEQELRPPNEFEKWILRAKNRATSKMTLESPEIMNRSRARRLLPSVAFVALFCAGSLFFSQYWQAPKRSDRLWPDMSLSFATVAGIMAINVGIYVLWRFPPAWGILNRFFLVVPATPRPISLFGNIFSHVQTKHLLFNMLPLLVFGPSLHEDLGRGNFLALYLASGVLGSFASLTHHTLRGIMYTSSLGASGSVWAVTAAFFCIHSDNDFTVFFMPAEWKEHAYIKGWMLFSCLIAIDIVGGLRGKPITVDYVAHASGALSGWLLAEWFKWRKAQSEINGEFVPRTNLPWWQFIFKDGQDQDKGGS